jgi:hypothetical protein
VRQGPALGERNAVPDGSHGMPILTGTTCSNDCSGEQSTPTVRHPGVVGPAHADIIESKYSVTLNQRLSARQIITLERSSRLAQAVSVQAGRVVAVGCRSHNQAHRPRGPFGTAGALRRASACRSRGLKARGGIPIAGLHSVTAIVDVVKGAAQTTPAREWIVLKHGRRSRVGTRTVGVSSGKAA